ncbi:hypothetical protein CMV_020937 [Castanea mollissima]|uniref:RNase H type-1 domain-containing protein n=1 Tax=Castanea mollissima TaxID=60419 RepID=A0A8J4VD49_9ROSI|nr:hypothetical protein CMV_020937 [Castanea mollissima]
MESITHTEGLSPSSDLLGFLYSSYPPQLILQCKSLKTGSELIVPHTRRLFLFSDISWGIIFPFGAWSLWLQRNRVIFRDHTTHRPLMAEILAKASEFAYLGLNERCPVSGNARAIGHTTSVVAELWALRDGINLCIELNLAIVLVELDVKLVIDLLMKD